MLAYILRNSLRNLRRTVLTVGIFAVSIAVTGLLAQVYMVMFIREAPPEQALRFIVRNKTSFLVPLPESYLSSISKIAGVRAVAPLEWFGGKYKDENDPNNFFAQYATDPVRLLEARQDLQLSAEARNQFAKNRTACILGEPLASRLHLASGDKVVLRGDWADMDLTVAGIYRAPVDNENLYFNREYEQQSYPEALRGRVGIFLVAVNGEPDTQSVPQLIDAAFHNSTAPTRTESEQSFLLSFVTFIGNIKVFLAAVCAATALLMLLAAANAALLSVRERMAELGVLKSLGFPTAYILSLIVGETVVHAISGALIGCGFALLLCMGIREGPFLPPQLKDLTMSSELIAGCTLLAAFLAVGALVLPACKISRLSVVAAIHNSD